MEPFYHLPPSSTTRDLPSPHTPLRRLDLQTVTNEWLSLTLDPSASTPIHSLPTTPLPPTPPPLPSDFAPFLKAQEPKAPSPVISPRGVTLQSKTFSRTPPLKEGGRSVSHTPLAPPFVQSPPPPPHSSLSCPLPDYSLQHTSGKAIAQKFYIFKPEVLSCTVPEPIKSPTQISLCQNSNVQVNKGSKISDIELQVKDPYDELLLMILDGGTNTDVAAFSRSSLVDSPPAPPSSESQSKFKLKAKESHPPDVKPAAGTPPSDPAGSIQLEAQFQKPVRIEPLSITWEGLSKSLNEPVETSRSSSVIERGFTELFIEEEEDTKEAKEEDLKSCNERLTPQVELHLVSLQTVQSLLREMEGNIMNITG